MPRLGSAEIDAIAGEVRVTEANKYAARLPAMAALLLLAFVAGAWLALREDAAPVIDHSQAPPKRAVPRKKAATPPSTPTPETTAPAEPEMPRPEPAKVALPELTRFRALVLEADSALLATEPPLPRSDEAWHAYSVLQQLRSRFAPHARMVYEGEDNAADRAAFEAEVLAAFRNPGVTSDSFELQQGRRVALWLRQGASLPAPEALSDAGAHIPITRRLQETVDVAAATSWLAAMEAEFGATTYGVGNLPLDVVLLANQSEYLAFTRQRLRLAVPAWSAGMFSSGWQVVCMPITEALCVAEVLRHEMFHAVQARLAPESLLVPWFAEGTAEWLDKAPPSGGKLRTHATFAASAWGYLAVLIEGGLRLNLREFLTLDQEAFYRNPQLHYLLAYCWVDFARTEEDLRPLYYEFWSLLKQGVGREQAFARTFGGLDLEEVAARMLERARKSARNPVAPRFAHDAHESALDILPPTLTGAPGAPGDADQIDSGWFGVVSELQRRGFDTARAAALDTNYDLLVIAIDSSETMAQRIAVPSFDWPAFARWVFALEKAGALTFNRGDSSSGEQVPAAVKLALIEAVLTGRVEEFTAATGVRVDKRLESELQDDFERQRDLAATLSALQRRDLCRRVAHSMSLYWGRQQNQARVVVIDFNSAVAVEVETGHLEGGPRDEGLISRLFEKTAGNAAGAGANGTDCDWWGALSGIAGAIQESGATAPAVLFFTDGPNSAGAYGHPESGRDDERYLAQQETMAKDFALQWQALQPSGARLQLFALPGAEGQGLEYLPQHVADARLDVWSQRFNR